MAVALGAFGLLFGGCAAETGGSAQPIVGGDASVPVSSLQIPEGLEEAAAPDWRLRVSTGAIDACAETGEFCETGEQCCALTGECVPAECDDCCVNPEIAGGPHDDPELDAPEGPDEPE